MLDTASLAGLIWPNHTNHYRPWLSRGLVVLPILSVLFVVNLLAITKPTVLGSYSDITPSEIIRLTNQYRMQSGLEALVHQPLLDQAAQAKAEAMVAADVFEHYYQKEGSEVTPWQFIDQVGYQYLHAGENLARHYQTAAEVVEAWYQSPAHKANLLSDQFLEIGVGVVEASYQDRANSILVVQLLATPLDPSLAEFVVATSSGTFTETSLLSHQRSWVQILLDRYPVGIMAISFAIVVCILLAVVAEKRGKPRLKPQPVSSALWRS